MKNLIIVLLLSLGLTGTTFAENQFNERSKLVHIVFGNTNADEVKFVGCPFVVDHRRNMYQASAQCSMKVPDPKVYSRIPEIFDDQGNLLYNVKFVQPYGSTNRAGVPRVCEINPESYKLDSKTELTTSTLWFTLNTDELTGELIPVLHGQLTCLEAIPSDQ